MEVVGVVRRIATVGRIQRSDRSTFHHEEIDHPQFLRPADVAYNEPERECTSPVDDDLIVGEAVRFAADSPLCTVDRSSRGHVDTDGGQRRNSGRSRKVDLLEFVLRQCRHPDVGPMRRAHGSGFLGATVALQQFLRVHALAASRLFEALSIRSWLNCTGFA